MRLPLPAVLLAPGPGLGRWDTPSAGVSQGREACAQGGTVGTGAGAFALSSEGPGLPGGLMTWGSLCAQNPSGLAVYMLTRVCPVGGSPRGWPDWGTRDP